MPSTLPEEKLVLGNSLFATGTQISTIIASTIGAFLLSKVNIYLFLFLTQSPFCFLLLIYFYYASFCQRNL